MDRVTSQIDRSKPSPLLQSMVDKSRHLSNKEQIALTKLLPDEKALETLVCSNLRFVYSVAFPLVHLDMSMDDKIMSGVEGLVIGLGKYDPDHKVTVLTYCVHWIRQRIMNYAGLGPMIRLPTNVVLDMNKVQKVGMEATEEDILEETGLTPSRISTAKYAKSIEVMSMDKHPQSMVSGRDLNPTLAERIKDEGAVDPSDHIVKMSSDEYIRSVIDGLEGRQRHVLELRYDKGFTLQEVGDLWGTSKEYARQVEHKAKNMVRKRLVRGEYAAFMGGATSD